MQAAEQCVRCGRAAALRDLHATPRQPLAPPCHLRTQAYDGGDGMFAARLWWLLTLAGHTAAYVLEGGWCVAGLFKSRCHSTGLG